MTMGAMFCPFLLRKSISAEWACAHAHCRVSFQSLVPLELRRETAEPDGGKLTFASSRPDSHEASRLRGARKADTLAAEHAHVHVAHQGGTAE